MMIRSLIIVAALLLTAARGFWRTMKRFPR